MSEELDKIWDGDFFERRKEAAFLEQYLESIWKRPNLREDSKGFVLAVDADYGMGKTFFLKRFADQMAMNHPVAYIDAWKDDLHDEPLIAIIATLEDALDKAIEKVEGDEKPKIVDAKKDYWEVLKKVSGIIGKGVLKKAAGMIITASAAEAVSNIIEGEDEEIQEAIRDQIKDVGKDSVEGIISISKAITSGGKLDERIKDFKEARDAVKLLKESLSALVQSLHESNIHAPIVIVIDELDRCRPTYAIKLLEEVKHLFDVEGLVFVLGTNLNQLEKASDALYGARFESSNYFQRFYDRRYSIANSTRVQFISNLVKDFEISSEKYNYFTMVFNGKEFNSFEGVLLLLCNLFGFSHRELYTVFTMLQTCQTLSRSDNLIFLPQLMRVVCERIKGIERLQDQVRSAGAQAKFLLHDRHFQTAPAEYTLFDFYNFIDQIIAMPFQEFNTHTSTATSKDKLINAIGRQVHFETGITSIKNYHQLVNWVQRID